MNLQHFALSLTASYRTRVVIDSGSISIASFDCWINKRGCKVQHSNLKNHRRRHNISEFWIRGNFHLLSHHHVRYENKKNLSWHWPNYLCSRRWCREKNLCTQQPRPTMMMIYRTKNYWTLRTSIQPCLLQVTHHTPHVQNWISNLCWAALHAEKHTS